MSVPLRFVDLLDVRIAQKYHKNIKTRTMPRRKGHIEVNCFSNDHGGTLNLTAEQTEKSRPCGKPS
jgi:hypothetical protein